MPCSLFSSDEGYEFLEAIVEAMPPRARLRWREAFDRAAMRASLKLRQEALEADIALVEARQRR